MKAASLFLLGLGWCVSASACVAAGDARTDSPGTLRGLGKSSGNADGSEELQVSEWGEEAHGLQCRVTMPTQIEEGMPLDAAVEIRAVPEKLPPNVRVLNPCHDMCTYLSLHLENVETSQRFAIEANHRTFGPPPWGDKGEHAITLNESPIAPWTPKFTLSRVEPKLRPASYRCFVRYAQPDEPTPGWRGTRAEWEALGPWAGTVKSVPLTIEVLPETIKIRTFLVPKRLRVIKKPYYWREGMPNKPPRDGYLLTTYAAEDTEEITLPVRNGHWVGHVITGGYGETHRGGPPEPNDPNGIEQWHRYEDGDREVTYKITLFETCTDNPRFVGPGSCGYKVLWERTFDLHFTEAEIKAILAQQVLGKTPDL